MSAFVGRLRCGLQHFGEENQFPKHRTDLKTVVSGLSHEGSKFFKKCKKMGVMFVITKLVRMVPKHRLPRMVIAKMLLNRELFKKVLSLYTDDGLY